MKAIVEILKSRGKLGAIAVMMIGLGEFVAIGFGKMGQENMPEAGFFFATGLSLLGIRGALPPTP